MTLKRRMTLPPTPRIARRVVWGRDDMIATFSPTSAFMSVDLPTLGLPTKHAKPLLWRWSVILVLLVIGLALDHDRREATASPLDPVRGEDEPVGSRGARRGAPRAGEASDETRTRSGSGGSGR